MQVFAGHAHNFNDVGDDFSLPFYQTEQGSSFLSPRSDKYFVCGVKGIGKTLLLLKKSDQDRKSGVASLFIPTTTRVEKLNERPMSFSDKDASELSEPAAWRKYWVAALVAVIVVEASIATGEEPIAEVFGEGELSVGAAIQYLLSNRHESRIRDFVNVRAARLLPAIAKQVRSGVRIYVDAVDEFTNSDIGEPLKEATRNGATQLGRRSEALWTASQIGFGLAALDIMGVSTHIRIYASMRSDALEMRNYQLQQNLVHHVLNISYSHTDLRKIWETKVETLQAHLPVLFRLEASEGRSATECFFGFTKLRHPKVADESGRATEEDVVDYIIRHTRGRPREMDWLGHELQYTNVGERNENTVRAVVRDQSRRFYQWAQTEATPYWLDGNDHLLEAVETNFISRSERKALYDRLQDKHDLSCEGVDRLFGQMFAIGLVGYVKKSDTIDVQVFKQADPVLRASFEEFQKASHIVMHPCVNLSWYSLRENYQANRWNVAGHGIPFRAGGAEPHVHFGMGALGVGLVAPLLLSNNGLTSVFVQRTDGRSGGKWQVLPQTGGVVKVRLKVPDAEVGTNASSTIDVPLVVLRDDVNEEQLEKYLSEWKSGARNLLIFGDRADVAAKFLGVAGSYSSSVGAGLDQVVDRVVEMGKKGTQFYPFENSEDAIVRAKSRLREVGIATVKVMVDRICTDVAVTEDSLVGTCERYVEIAVNDNLPRTNQMFGPPHAPSWTIHMVENEAEFGRILARKRLLVNGLHYVLAVLGYNKLLDAGLGAVSKDLADAQLMSILVRHAEIEEQLLDVNNLFIAKLICDSFPGAAPTTIAEAEKYLIALMRYSADVRSRFRRNPDFLSRVLKMQFGAAHEKYTRFFVQELLALRSATPERFNSLWNKWYSDGWRDTIDEQLKVFHLAHTRVSTAFLLR